MSCRMVAAFLAISVAVAVAPRAAVAEDHLTKAISHTKEAIDHGAQGHADVLVTYANEALTHANAAEKAKDNAEIRDGIIQLNAAIAEGKNRNAALATQHAMDALTHLEAAPPATQESAAPASPRRRAWSTHHAHTRLKPLYRVRSHGHRAPSQAEHRSRNRRAGTSIEPANADTSTIPRPLQ